MSCTGFRLNGFFLFFIAVVVIGINITTAVVKDRRNPFVDEKRLELETLVQTHLSSRKVKHGDYDFLECNEGYINAFQWRRPSAFFSDYPEYEEKVRCRNEESVYKIIEQLINNGPSKLKVITDFDYTLSKHHTNDRTLTPAADIIRLSPFMSDEFRMRSRQRFEKLLPVELDASLTIEQKIPTVIASFQEGFADIVDSKVVNRRILAQMIDEAGDDFQLRDRCDETLKCLYDAKIPVLIFSAGFGDLVKGILHKHSLYYSNINVVGNFMEFDDKERLVGFQRPLIHTFNKNSSVIPANCFDELSHRNNVILLGDSIGDVSMAEGVQRCGNLLKIGFLNEVNEEQLNIFLETFDIVLLDDQTTNFVNFLLNRIIAKGAEL